MSTNPLGQLVVWIGGLLLGDGCLSLSRAALVAFDILCLQNSLALLIQLCCALGQLLRLRSQDRLLFAIALHDTIDHLVVPCSLLTRHLELHFLRRALLFLCLSELPLQTSVTRLSLTALLHALSLELAAECSLLRGWCVHQVEFALLLDLECRQLRPLDVLCNRLVAPLGFLSGLCKFITRQRHIIIGIHRWGRNVLFIAIVVIEVRHLTSWVDSTVRRVNELSNLVNSLRHVCDNLGVCLDGLLHICNVFFKVGDGNGEWRHVRRQLLPHSVPLYRQENTGIHAIEEILRLDVLHIIILCHTRNKLRAIHDAVRDMRAVLR
mmetsp:Transcript_75598/g.87909  ORF Transcript_75598/g.87909 Transcript_75598/m.87909 type:complete len:323 (-) Transcript_75598:1054-2022(-)